MAFAGAVGSGITVKFAGLNSMSSCVLDRVVPNRDLLGLDTAELVDPMARTSML